MSNKNMPKSRKESSSANVNVLSATDIGITTQESKDVSVSFSIWIRSLMQNWRQGTVACKGRSDVAHSNKKPWKQKGTGRARAGSARSPLWRGGGVIFGPQPRVRTLRVSKQLKQSVMGALLHKLVEKGRISTLDWQLNADVPKTSHAFNALKSAGFEQKKVALFLPFDDALARASFINIPNVRILSFDELNAYEVAHCQQLLVLNRDLDQFKEMVSQWI
jgi:large subunit ribosomal protein L4